MENYGRSGFINAQGEMVINRPNTHLTNDFSKNGLVAAPGKGGWGYVDAGWQWVIEPKFAYVNSFSDDGLAIVTAAGTNNSRGAINNEGQWVVEPKFERLESVPFSAMGSDKINGRWVHINHQGQWLGEFLYGDWIKQSVTGHLMKGDLQVRPKKLYRTGVFVDARGLYRTGLDEDPQEPGFRWEFGDDGRTLLNRRGRKF